MLFLPLLIAGVAAVGSASVLTIVHDQASTRPAKELRRYLYLATNELPHINATEAITTDDLLATGGVTVIVAPASSTLANSVARTVAPPAPLPSSLDSLLLRFKTEDDDAHALHTVRLTASSTVLLCVGSGVKSTSFSVFSLIERVTSVRFHLDGDVLPDRTLPLPSLRSIAKRLETEPLNVRMAPTASVRGLQPFHDFSEGPDWWNGEEYKHHFDQMHKMKLNFLGLHTYPLSEPTVWTGVEADVDANGTVKPGPRSRYFTSYENTGKGGDWGGTAENTSGYAFGAHQLFSHECYGAEAQMVPMADGGGGGGATPLCPAPATDAARGVLFNRVGAMLNDSFTYARSQLGHKTCVGIESLDGGIKKPDPNVSSVEYFRGIFTRINRTYPIDYFWIWTPEGWHARQDPAVPVTDPAVQAPLRDMLAADTARKELGLEDDLQLATCGWTVGPKAEREYFDKVLPKDGWTISSINEAVGNVNCEPEYAKITEHPKWSIPWMEDDPGLTGVQLWANRTLVYAAQAAQYGAEGLLGIHWRTKAVAPQLLALARFPWDPALTSLGLYTDLCATSFGLSPADAAGLARVWDAVDSYHPAPPPNPPPPTPPTPPTPPPPTPPPMPPSGRDCKLAKVVGCYRDQAAPRVLPTMVTVRSESNDHEWCAGWCAAKNFTLAGVEFGVACFCGRAAPPASARLDDGVGAGSQCAKMKCAGNQSEGCGGSFVILVYTFTCTNDSGRGSGSGSPLRIGAGGSIGSGSPAGIPRPDAWVDGPGKIVPKPYEPSLYAFVDAFGAYRGKVKGPANLARFDYWRDSLEYLRAMAQTAGAWDRLAGATAAAAAAWRAHADPAGLVAAYTKEVVPARVALVAAARAMSDRLLQTVGTTGAMGTVANLQQHSFPDLLGATHAAMLGLFDKYSGCGPDLATAADEVCLSDCGARLLPATVAISSQANSRGWCATQCWSRGYALAGVENGVACFCGNATAPHPPPAAAVRPMQECRVLTCPANGTEPCGGHCRLLVYNISCAEDPRVPAPPPLPAAAMPDARYTGAERLFVLTPRTVAEGGRLQLTIMALVRDPAKLGAVNVRTRPMGGGGGGSWSPPTRAKPAAAADADERAVFSVELASAHDFEYYVEAGGSSGAALLQWPAGGAANAHTVVVV